MRATPPGASVGAGSSSIPSRIMPFMTAKVSTNRWCLTHGLHQDSRYHTAAYGCSLRWSNDYEELGKALEDLKWFYLEFFRIPQIVDWLSVGLSGGGWRRRGCSSCGQPLDSPPCARNSETGKGGHTIVGGVGVDPTREQTSG